MFAVVFLFITRCRFPKSRSLAGRYSNPVLKIIRKYGNLDYKICKLPIDIEFLKNCLNHDFSATFLKYKM